MQNSERAESDFIWDSELIVLNNVTVAVPRHLLLLCDEIQKRVGYNEFSILVSGEWSEIGFELSEEYVIPSQTVSFRGIQFKEPLEKYKRHYNSIIHSHPAFGCVYGRKMTSWFSQSDDETINTHFTCSVLYTEREFSAAVVTIQLNRRIKLKLDATIEIKDEEFKGAITGIENIRPLQYLVPKDRFSYRYFVLNEANFAANVRNFNRNNTYSDTRENKEGTDCNGYTST